MIWDRTRNLRGKDRGNPKGGTSTINKAPYSERGVVTRRGTRSGGFSRGGNPSEKIPFKKGGDHHHYIPDPRQKGLELP